LKLSQCERCNLCNSRLRPSFSKGIKEANVFVVFGKEPHSTKGKRHIEGFIDQLKKYLQWDWHYDFAIKCHTKDKANDEYIKACRKWLFANVKRVKPYLIILMGRVACKSMLGIKYRNIQDGIFYLKKDKKGNKHQYYIGCSIQDHPAIIEKHINKINSYIKEHYG
jgi:uracil-DNA glycosylase